MTQLSSKVLQKVAEELNDFLDITPRISTKSTDEELREKILEAAGLLVVDGKVNEMLELSKTTQRIITELCKSLEKEVELDDDGFEKEEPLKSASKKSEPEEEEEEELGTDLEANVKGAEDLEELVDYIKAYKSEFPMASRGVQFAKDVEKLRAKALADLGAEAEEVEDPEKPSSSPAKKKESTKAPVKKETKVPAKKTGKSGEKKPQVIATIVSLIEGAGKKGISKYDILKSLVKEFPERAEDSMKKTVQVQVPGRINRERFELVEKNGLYSKK